MQDAAIAARFAADPDIETDLPYLGSKIANSIANVLEAVSAYERLKFNVSPSDPRFDYATHIANLGTGDACKHIISALRRRWLMEEKRDQNWQHLLNGLNSWYLSLLGRLQGLINQIRRNDREAYVEHKFEGITPENERN